MISKAFFSDDSKNKSQIFWKFVASSILNNNNVYLYIEKFVSRGTLKNLKIIAN